MPQLQCVRKLPHYKYIRPQGLCRPYFLCIMETRGGKPSGLAPKAEETDNGMAIMEIAFAQPGFAKCPFA